MTRPWRTGIRHGDVLDLIAGVEEVHDVGAVRDVEVHEIVQVIVRVKYQRVGVISPQIDQNVLQQHALQQQPLLVVVRPEVVLL